MKKDAQTTEKKMSYCKAPSPFQPSPFQPFQSQIDKILSGNEDWAITAVDYILAAGARNQASDIHLEPFVDRVQVRFRIDGMLKTVGRFPKDFEENLVSRFKVISKLVTYRKKLPQDGRIKIRYKEKDVDLRFSFFPTIHGEKVVIRFMSSTRPLRSFDELGFPEEINKKLKGLLEKNQGTILLTGPAGSGKTTTMYASLKYIQQVGADSCNIMTIEDPVEYDLGSINQSQVNPVAGITFSSGLRSLLRQDPDVIMIGEIRDRETAEIAIQAGLTGHLILSTIHSGTAIGVFTRLINLEVEPYMVASSIKGIVAQRLVGIICPECRVDYTPSEKIMAQMPNKEKFKNFAFRKGRGCKKCGMSGYTGRTGIFELLLVDDNIRDLVVEKAQSRKIMEAVKRHGMKNMLDDGIEKVIAGITTIEEVIKVT
ncbi:MAG: GspE/PulE family protein [bacterium]